MPPGLLQWATPTAGGLLALVVLAIVFGFLVPVGTVKRELSEISKRCANAEATAELHAKRADRLAELLAELMPYARNVDELLKELRRRIEREAGP